MKNSKKIIATLTTALFLSTSIVQAKGTITTKTKTYNPQDNRSTYTINYNSNLSKYPKNIIVKITPIFDKDFNNTKNNSNSNQGSKNSNTSQNNNKTNNNNNNNNQNKPENPVNSEPTKQTPKESENRTTTPQQPQKPTESSTNPSTSTEKPNNSNVSQSSSVEKEVARLVNLERQKVGLAPLTFSEEISKVARLKSQDMADKNYFSHTSPTYGDPFQMMKTFGIKYGYAGENIAKGYRDAQSVMNGWMNSSGHKANILNSNFKKIGVGYVQANGTTYWTQMFTD